MAAVAAVLALAGAAMLAGPAAADIDGPCTASIAGTNVSGLDATSADDAIEVDEDARIVVTMSSAKEIDHLTVSVALAGQSYDAKDGPSSGTSWTRTIEVDDYSRWGVGLYQVTGSSSGPGLECSGAALVQVDGSPLAKPAGWAAIGLTALGALVLLGLAVSGRSGGGRIARTLLGLLAGLSTALGILALLQQYSVLYPTSTIAWIGLGIGAVVGLAIPLLTGRGGAPPAPAPPPSAPADPAPPAAT